MSKFFAWVKALSAISKVTGFFGGFAGVASLGFLGPAAPFVAGFFGAIGKFIGWVFEGVQISISKPVVLALETVILAFGIWQGVRWDGHLVDRANVEIASLEAKIQAAKDADDAKAKAAIEAREAAKKLPAVAAPAAPAADPAHKPKRVRKPAADKNLGDLITGSLPSF